MSRSRHQQGITIIEMTVVIVILAILALTVTPSFLTYMQTNRLIGTTQTLYDALQEARTEAIKSGTTVYVNFVVGSSWCYGFNAGSTCSCNVANSCGLGSTSAATAGQQSLALTGFTATSMTFDPNHGATYVAGTITFTTVGTTNAIGIMVGLGGSLQLCSNTVTGYQACTSLA